MNLPFSQLVKEILKIECAKLWDRSAVVASFCTTVYVSNVRQKLQQYYVSDRGAWCVFGVCLCSCQSDISLHCEVADSEFLYMYHIADDSHYRFITVMMYLIFVQYMKHRMQIMQEFWNMIQRQTP